MRSFNPDVTPHGAVGIKQPNNYKNGYKRVTQSYRSRLGVGMEGQQVGRRSKSTSDYHRQKNFQRLKS